MPTFSPFGDSLTTGHKATLTAGITAGTSYVCATATGGLTRSLGFAASGYNAYQIFDNAMVTNADVAVWMAGTNDMSQNVARYKTRIYMFKALDLIHAKQNLVLAIPPMIGCEEKVNDFNYWLEEIVWQSGSEFLDPWVTFKDGAGYWLEGVAKIDGRHPTDTTSAALGGIIRDKILAILPAN